MTPNILLFTSFNPYSSDQPKLSPSNEPLVIKLVSIVPPSMVPFAKNILASYS